MPSNSNTLNTNWRRQLPSADYLLRHSALAEGLSVSQRLLLRAIRDELAALRALNEEPASEQLSDSNIVARIRLRIHALQASMARRVFNLTGTVIHTNLGRSLLSEASITAMANVARSPVALEYRLLDGKRGDRDDLIEALLCELTGAEAATVVNNNAAAVLLSLSALGSGGEVIVSRGELIEIGGAFRIPDIMQAAGCQLREVGTTNRTHPRDYQAAITETTSLISKIHTSNYAIEGFTRSVSESELAKIAHAANLPLLVDLGSGALLDMSTYGLPREPLPQEVLAAGADIATFSGDKLLGGPQAGIIVGRADLIARIKRHPLKRALRLDKLVLAALEATLKHYRDDDFPEQSLPTLSHLSRTQANIYASGERVLAALVCPDGIDAHLADASSQIGSGSQPVERLPSCALVITPKGAAKQSERRLRAIEASMRALERPIIGRIKEHAIWLDLRCLAEEDEAELTELIARCLQTRDTL